MIVLLASASLSSLPADDWDRLLIFIQLVLLSPSSGGIHVPNVLRA